MAAKTQIEETWDAHSHHMLKSGEERTSHSGPHDWHVDPDCDPFHCELQACIDLQKSAGHFYVDEKCPEEECDYFIPDEDREDLVVENLSPTEEETWNVAKISLNAKCGSTSGEAMDVSPVDSIYLPYVTHPVDQILDSPSGGLQELASTNLLMHYYDALSVVEAPSRDEATPRHERL